LQCNCERTTDYRSRISCVNLTLLFALFVFYCADWRVHRSQSTLQRQFSRRLLKEHPIYRSCRTRSKLRDEHRKEINFRESFFFLVIIRKDKILLERRKHKIRLNCDVSFAYFSKVFFKFIDTKLCKYLTIWNIFTSSMNQKTWQL
jgi:hypothetical protein